MSKHTPGPWLAVGMGSEGYNIYTDDFGKASYSEQRFHGAIARVHGGDWKTIVANSNLIASAPELLEACEKAISTLLRHNILGETHLILRDAIAKAKGGEI